MATQRRFHGAGDDWRPRPAHRCRWASSGRSARIAEFVAFLLSDRSGVVTGSVIDLGPERAGRDGLMRLGLLGLGRIGAFHAETLAGLPAVEELVISEPGVGAGRTGGRTVRRADRRKPRGGASVRGRWMVIAAPTGLHTELIELCVAAGLPTFCEKPVARDSGEAARLARRVGRRGRAGPESDTHAGSIRPRRRPRRSGRWRARCGP